ncbi:MAG: mannose-1-phosphate guanylyltransferase/mannose-6-phosphate isomerase [Ramlibacter sp.]
MSTQNASQKAVTPVILCGGSGTRLWPLSRAGFPKQFLCLTGNESLFQLAARRLAGLSAVGVPVSAPLVVTNDEHRFLAAEQLREAGILLGAALLEPAGRNTAPALTLAALACLEAGDDPVLLVTPADQTIADEPAFARSMQAAIAEAQAGAVVIFGVVPDRPESGYGYIRVARSAAAGASQAPAQPVERFFEKPDAATAQSYLDAGGHYWNSGMFVLKASVWLQALAQLCPAVAQATRAAWDARTHDPRSPALDAAFVRPGQAEFNAIAGISIDHAVMEPLAARGPAAAGLPALKMVPLDAGWSDLGAWDAVWQALPKDGDGNAPLGDVLTTRSQGNLVHASSRLVCLVGVRDLIVVETPDAVLVADRANSQDVKTAVAALTAAGRPELASHRKVHRPWGWYDSIDEGPRFKVKRIMVKPKASLSLQMHHHRAEHWVVVKGTAEITHGDKTLILTENQSTYIPLGEVHRLANPGTMALEIIEVQSGSYLGEDDIVRLEDSYGRK